MTSSARSDEEGDSILPVRIEHNVDEIWDGDRLEQRYVYMDYHFDRCGERCRARSYLDDFNRITIISPEIARERTGMYPGSLFDRDIVAYLERRFAHVVRLE